MTFKASRYYGIGFALFAVGFAACSSDQTTNNNPGGGAGSPSAGHSGVAGSGVGGGSAGSGFAGSSVGGSATAGGSTGGASGAATGGAATGGGSTGGAATGGGTCVAPASATVTEFTDLVPTTDVANPGGLTFMMGIPGGTSTYAPNVLTATKAAEGALNVKGTVNGYDGFVVYLNGCTNAMAYSGVSFDIKGNVGVGGVQFRFQSKANKASAYGGPCPAPDKATSYDLCHDAQTVIMVPAGGGNVSVKFGDVVGGVPNATVNGSDIVGFEWAFVWAGMADTPYPVDVTIDNIKFTGGPSGAGGSGGGSSAGAGGSSAGAGGSSAGAGGSSAGAGGTTAGSGGSNAGTGGAKAGTGGV